MSGIKGLVLLTRFDFIEEKYGRERLKLFWEQVDLKDKSIFHQPIVISKEYPELILKAVDEAIEKQFFKDKEPSFRRLGHWIAGHLMLRYFQIYVDEHNPVGFLQQIIRMRPTLIGLGTMNMVDLGPNNYLIKIDYGQPYLPSVYESELGFLEESVRLCGGRNVQVIPEEKNEFILEFRMHWE
ncbi:MAG TPA: hypothetical protein ENK44_05145 [Caldithrix abyssi]|uniref:Uncharacterized protein n=1 Tax=Caldithrix abyssi TaxID=187145 RepID=A0A7V4TZA8_CALAY|nr:hypothetical protein [Caldithrix abyssi]